MKKKLFQASIGYNYMELSIANDIEGSSLFCLQK